MLPCACASSCSKSSNLYTVPRLPQWTFQGAGVKTVVLFFEKGPRPRKICSISSDPGRNLGKTNPLNDATSPNSSICKNLSPTRQILDVGAKTIDQTTFDLSVKNPNGAEAVAHRTPQEILDEIAGLGRESAEVLQTIPGTIVESPPISRRRRDLIVGAHSTVARGVDLVQVRN